MNSQSKQVISKTHFNSVSESSLNQYYEDTCKLLDKAIEAKNQDLIGKLEPIAKRLILTLERVA